MLDSIDYSPATPLQRQLRSRYREDENRVLAHLLQQNQLDAPSRARIWARAKGLIEYIRQRQQGKGGVDALLQEFSLSTEEGIVLMCLAEALLRVPDKHTMDRLIRDKLAGGDWDAHLGNSDSLFVNASAWGLLLSGKMVSYGDEQNSHRFGVLKQTMGRMGEPVIRRAVRYAMEIMGTQFVLGTNIGQALEQAKVAEADGFRYSYDMLGEGARTEEDAQRYLASYNSAIEQIGAAAAQGGPDKQGPEPSPGISVKLSAIHPRYEFAQRQRVLDELVPRLLELALAAKAHNIGFTVDAEEADRLELSMAVIEAVYLDARLDGWQGFGLAVQAYQKRAPLIIDWLAELAERGGRKIMVRLVKGAYWDSEIKWSQEAGLADYPVFTRKASTDVCYQICAQKLLDARAQLFPQFATHNAYTVATILELDKERSGYEFQRLHGMGEALYENLVKDTGLSCRIYAPVGEHADLLAYLVRRLLENGANSSFVNNIVDESVPVESLLQDPCLSVAVWDDVRNSVIPLPKDIYRAEFAAGSIQPRANAKGLELSDADECEALKQSLASLWQLYCEQCNEKHSYRVSNPALRSETVGGYDMDNPQSIEAKLTAAVEVQPQWQAAGVNARAEVLEQLAEALEQQRDELILLCVKEAGKTLADAVAEIREAVDFCRYYARQAQLVDAGQARGVVLCISPWNFPLAIFLGQVAAALVCGNTVLAKPAEQTSLIALRCLALLQKICTERGLPAALLQLLLGPGKAIGEQLVPDPRIAAVMFTGSTATGQWINRCLAGRADNNIPLIAETGGQNAMIVDSTALPEQVVDDVLSSGFQSAGQRCSALRVLFLQEDVADKIIAMIKGAMAQLNIGDPAFLRTDVGPVIDSAALERLNAHRQRLAQLPDRQARLLYRCELPERHEKAGTFFAPELYEIASLDLLSEEVFGPVVHVVRYKAGQMDQLLAQIGSSGFGLTLGVHSRIQAVSERIAERAPVGNVYINRNIIGAIVGVQPFGGHGLSGTGPKAGGPDYLTALLADGSADQPQVDIELPELTPAQGLDLAPADPGWQALPYEQRRAAAQDFLAKLAALSQSPQLSTAMAAAEATLERMETLLAQPSLLPGPTGERNIHSYQARGLLLLMAASDSLEQRLHEVIGALAAGNQIIWAAAPSDRDRELLGALAASRLPAEQLQLLEPAALGAALAHPALAGVMAPANWPALRRRLAQRDGAIIPLLASSNQFFERRLCLEKSVSIDTTAAGGNASLMAMSED